MELKNVFDFNFQKIKPLAISAVCFASVFIAGYGVGKSSIPQGDYVAKRSLSNYNMNNPAPTKPQINSDASNCTIKGSKSKVYHVPGGSFYDRTNPAACFASEEEAQAAGYVKSSR
jgi:hypothetical protein